MSEATWEKSTELAQKLQGRKSQQRWLYLAAGLALVGVVVFLVIQGTILGSSYFKTVEELSTDASLIGKKVRVSGAVVQKDGKNDVRFDSDSNTLYFSITHIPNDSDEIREGGGLGTVLASAVAQSNELPTIQVIYVNREIPDLIYSDEPTQAIVEGKLGDDGIFYATSLQLKCPTKYADDIPEQVASN